MVFGYEGNDTITGVGNTHFKGGGGADTLIGTGGIDTADYSDSPEGVNVNLITGVGFGGTAQGDRLFRIDIVIGSFYSDFLVGSTAGAELHGPNGNDTLIATGLGSFNRLYGDNGDDRLKGSGGTDYLHGGDGYHDTVDYTTSSAGVDVSLRYTVVIDGQSYGTGRGGYAEHDLYQGIENIDGSAYGDRLEGNDADNVIRGFGGSDILDGGYGSDTMYGGLGNDTYRVHDVGDMVIETAGQGFDRVFVIASSYALASDAEIEALQVDDTYTWIDVILTGNDYGQEIQGNRGNNHLVGRGGNDTIWGRDGNDTFAFDTMLNAATNVDRIMDFNPAGEGIYLDDAIFSNLSRPVDGVLLDNEFRIEAAALDADDRIIYNNLTGALSYDSDGTGAAAAVQFAIVTAGLDVTRNDFYIF